MSCFQLNEISIRFKILFSFRSLISMLSPSSDVDFQRISSWLVHLQSLCNFRALRVYDDDITRPIGRNRSGRMVRALVHTVVENHVAFTARKGHFCHVHSLPLALHCGEPRPSCLLVKPILERRGSEVSGESDTIRARTNEPMESSRPVWRPVILLAPMLMSTGSSMI